MKINPRWWTLHNRARGVPGWHPVAPKPVCCLAGECLERIRGTVEYCNGDQMEDGGPPFPSRYLFEIIGPHEPDEAGARVIGAQGAQGIGGVAGMEPRLYTADDDTPIAFGQGLGGRHAFVEVCHISVAFQRILG